MGLDVELIRIENAGTSPKRRRVVQLAVVADPQFRLARAVEREQHGGKTPMLARVDLYSDLELTREEMPQLLAELSHLHAAAADDSERELIEATQRLAEQCHNALQLALRFVGD